MNFNLNLSRLNPPQNITLSYPKNIRQITITWDKVIKYNTETDPKIVAVKYNIYRSESINGIFYRLNSDFIESNRYDDTSISVNPNTAKWYKISTVAIYDNGECIEGVLSKPHTYEVKNNNKWFIKVNERNMWILKNTGVLMDLYTMKTTGERCPHCWDEIRGASAQSNCEYCYGSGFIGGYEPQFRIYVRQKPATQQLDISNGGFAINSNPGIWTISSVQLKNRDILINPEGRIFSVTNFHINHAAGYYFHQELQTKELDVTDVRYNIQRENLYPEF